ncbi:ATP-binding protein [Pseudomonas sp. NW5]|uniref:ATP-binding protein n=1 Tax=Pseudomonas sp. NW5 TaxID=2934934 RepID=UPI00202176F8|nr:ATP-binding protein [Pseudomonas sp. NW5]MCL7463240.1 ATP-binding protein [Pseudomonas sp. NW5]
MDQSLINEPDASRLIFGLRDTGYNFRTAAADIIDNSIAANADEVHVRISMTPEGRKFVYFGDNGDGMDAQGVHNALRYGAPERENLASLGKFGLGLKTASSSVCRRFTVISRRSPDASLTKLAWDLDHVESTGKWEMLREALEPHEEEAWEELCGDKGTLVVWSKCDRLLSKNYDEPGGTKEQGAIKRLRSSLKAHIGLIYHRFLDTDDDRQRNIKITVNDELAEPWNPFYPEKSEQVLSEPQQVIDITSVDGESTGQATIRAWILPNSNTLTKEERNKANITNRGQGFYIYREGRLINEGGWLGVFGSQGTFEPHMSLLRIEFDFGHDLDEAFYVDVKKSHILFDPAIEEYLNTLLKGARREAENRYRRKQKEVAAEAVLNHAPANVSIAETPNVKKPVVNEVDVGKQSATITNSTGSRIRIKQPVQNNVDKKSLFVDAVDDITSGELWVPALRSVETTGHVPGVQINKHHEFYQKIYLRARSSGYAVQGMDLLLWAFAVAELEYVNEEMAPIFADIREVVSSNLRKLLRSLPMPDEEDLADDGDE